MKLSAYISLGFFALLFMYNEIGDSSVSGWNVLYWTGLSIYIAVLNYELFRQAYSFAYRYIFLIAFLYWGWFALMEVITLFTPDEYFKIISNSNLIASRSLVLVFGLLLFFLYDKRDKRPHN